MVLYMVLSVAAGGLDLSFFVADESDQGAGFFVKLAVLAALVLKVALALPAIKAHDALPVTRPDRTLLAESNKAALQQRVQETVAAALREELQRLAVARPAAASSCGTPSSASRTAGPPGSGGGGATAGAPGAAAPRSIESEGTWDDV